jgi:hypothetical protein
VLNLVKRCTPYFFLLAFSCTAKEEKEVQRSFYYWKGAFRLTGKEKGILDSLQVKKLYIRFFDVDWDEEKQKALPIAITNFLQEVPPPVTVTPVVFITNETFYQLKGEEDLKALAQNISRLVRQSGAELKLGNELQVDCDWTEKTRDAYFNFLTFLRSEWPPRQQITATIRLHQLKYRTQAGIPPVDRGLLMAYNMGNLRKPGTRNSIIESSELKKYIGNLGDYPLALDIAFPLFSWYVLFHQEQYKGIIHRVKNVDPSFKGTIRFSRDTVWNGYRFQAGDWLRYEDSPINEIKECTRMIREKSKDRQLSLILYHLDESNLTKYTRYELESIFNSMR